MIQFEKPLMKLHQFLSLSFPVPYSQQVYDQRVAADEYEPSASVQRYVEVDVGERLDLVGRIRTDYSPHCRRDCKRYSRMDTPQSSKACHTERLQLKG